jgi:hypothetical protein
MLSWAILKLKELDHNISSNKKWNLYSQERHRSLSCEVKWKSLFSLKWITSYFKNSLRIGYLDQESRTLCSGIKFHFYYNKLFNFKSIQYRNSPGIESMPSKLSWINYNIVNCVSSLKWDSVLLKEFKQILELKARNSLWGLILNCLL